MNEENNTQEPVNTEVLEQQENLSPSEESHKNESHHDTSESNQSHQDESDNSNQVNWKRIREEKEAITREREYWRKQAEEAAKKRQDDDDLVEHKDLRQTKQEIQRELVNLKLAAKFPDFDSVVNSSNLTRFAKEEPELALSIDQTSDLYAKAVAAYKNIKNKQYNVRDSEKRQVEENSKKARPLASISPQEGNSPLSQANAFANGLTPELKKQLWKEMQECSNR